MVNIIQTLSLEEPELEIYTRLNERQVKIRRGFLEGGCGKRGCILGDIE